MSLNKKEVSDWLGDTESNTSVIQKNTPGITSKEYKKSQNAAKAGIIDKLGKVGAVCVSVALPLVSVVLILSLTLYLALTGYVACSYFQLCKNVNADIDQLNRMKEFLNELGQYAGFAVVAVFSYLGGKRK